MRLISFVQVLLLLALTAYLLLVALENPQVVRLPLPFGQGELSLPVGAAVALFLVTGVLYATLLFVPPLLLTRLRRRRDRQERLALEGRLTATLQARLGALPTLPTGGALTLTAPTAPAPAQAAPAQAAPTQAAVVLSEPERRAEVQA